MWWAAAAWSPRATPQVSPAAVQQPSSAAVSLQTVCLAGAPLLLPCCVHEPLRAKQSQKQQSLFPVGHQTPHAVHPSTKPLLLPQPLTPLSAPPPSPARARSSALPPSWQCPRTLLRPPPLPPPPPPPLTRARARLPLAPPPWRQLAPAGRPAPWPLLPARRFLERMAWHLPPWTSLRAAEACQRASTRPVSYRPAAAAAVLLLRLLVGGTCASLCVADGATAAASCEGAAADAAARDAAAELRCAHLPGPHHPHSSHPLLLTLPFFSCVCPCPACRRRGQQVGD